jgi:hypothetical protein
MKLWKIFRLSLPLPLLLAAALVLFQVRPAFA